MRKRLLSNDTVKMVRWLINNTKLTSSEISSFYECTYDIKICYVIIDKIRGGVKYEDVKGEIDINSSDLQRYICLCYPTTFMECKMPYIINDNNNKSQSFMADGPIDGFRLRNYENAKKLGLV